MNLKTLSEKSGKPIHYEKYRMWHGVPFIGDTAMVVDETVPGGGQRIIMPPMIFPEQVTEEYALAAIKNHAYSLGDYYVRKFSTDFIPWDERTWYPPGYFTHKIGDDLIKGGDLLSA